MPEQRSDEEKTLGERLLDEIEDRVGSRAQERVSEWLKREHDIHVSGPMISRYRKGEVPRMKMARDLAVAAGVNVEWLLSGRGEKYPMAPLSQDERDMINLYRQLPDDDVRRDWLGDLRLTVHRQHPRQGGQDDAAA